MSGGGISGLAPIQKVFQMAKKTFARSRGPDGKRRHRLDSQDLRSHLKQLSELMNVLTAKDLALDQSQFLRRSHTPNGRLSPTGESPPLPPPLTSTAPVTYIGLHEDQDLTVGVFAINPGANMPLHNHPGMHGILKVVHGTVEVAFYNRVEIDTPSDLPEPLRNRPDLLERDIVVPTSNPVKVTVGTNSDPLLLYPNKDNFHEIRLVGEGPAAFLDILSPPYNTETEDGHLEFPADERRDCGFYQIVQLAEAQGGNPSITWLHRLRQQPKEYVCDVEPYLGPSLEEFI